MLQGYCIYSRDNVKMRYKLTGVDDSVELRLTVAGTELNSYDNMADPTGVDTSDALWTRRADIQLSKIKVETAQRTDPETGKKVKAPVNTDFWCRFGALIRYAKQQCTSHNEKGYTGLKLASNEFETSDTSEYIITFPDGKGIFANVKLNLGSISYLKLSTSDFEIELEDDPSYIEIFPKIKDGFISGLRFDTEYLGFEVPVVAPKPIVTNGGMYTCIEDIVADHPDKEFSWLLKKDYHIVDDDHLEEVCQYIQNWGGYVYYDTETTGLNINFKSRTGQADQLVGVVLSVKYGESFFFPCQMKSIPNLCGGDHWYFMEHYMRPILEGKDLVTHNGEFDWRVAYIYDINAHIVHDTMWIIQLTLGASHKNWKVGLKSNAKILLHRDSLELSDLVKDNSWGESDIRFWDLPYELVRLYACADTDNTNGLLQYAIQNDLLNKYNASKVYQIEIGFMFAVAYQEFYGHHIDVNHIDEVRAEIGKEQNELMNEMLKMVGHEFNPNSSIQLRTIMYKELGIPEQRDRVSGKITTSKETLNKLASLTNADDEPMYPFAVALKKYREAEGVRKIIDKFPEHCTSDGYIFSEVNQCGASTGRVSITKPNYQSYNDPIKKNVTPRPGYYMFDTDYSSIEYRVLGNMVGNKNIMERFKDPDFDYHAYQASHMYGVPYSAVTKKLRKAAKGINFGLPYGMGDESLGVRVFGEASPENTRKARDLRAAYFKGQEDIRDWFEYHRDKGVNLGYTETYFGRRRYYHKQDFSEAKIRRQAGNQVIQGCLSGDTLIHTKEYGIRKIKDLAGLKAHVWNGYCWSDADILPSGDKVKCIVTFTNGQTITCSPEHKFLVKDTHGNTHWVEARDLKVAEHSSGSSHVMVNNKYDPSDAVYKSDRKKYRGRANNSNNVWLDDMHSSFDIGVFLGRLTSDGSIDKRDGRSGLTQFVAEHEYGILPELKKVMEPLDYKERTKDRSSEGKKEMKELTVYSSSLKQEVSDLDIRHKIADNIFMDSEVLRGFLSGYFDGDDGISGKSITLVCGVNDDYDKLCRDIQTALLFYGVRSHYRKYDDRYVIQISTYDNQLFCERIGFLNQDKQDKGMSLKAKETEKTFGHCIIVKSVEIFDELIPMYDVCNTTDGYYVANGIIVHNTAADLYKIGVGRFFKRICKEGWLGKVLFVGFIHDELLGEISLDIDPAKFLKALREEYEVKVVNEDGTPWSPLYMGFGFGRSWYEAKSTEWSIKLQWEWVAKYGEEGYPKWDGDADKFCDSIPDIIRDYDVRDIRNQLLDPEAQGKEIKPTLNNEIFDCIAYDKAHYKKGIEEYGGDMAGLEKYLDKKYHIQKVLRDSDGVLIDDFDWGKETQPCIDLYCKLHDTDRSKVNILDIPDIDTTEANNSGVNLELLDDEDDDEAQVKRTEAEIQSIVLNQGTFISTGRLYGLSYFINKYKDYILRVGHRVADDTSSNGYALWQLGKLNGELVQAYTGITLDYTDALDLYKMILHDFPLVKVS